MRLRRTRPGRHSRDTRCTRAAPSGASKDAGASAALRVAAGTGERAGARRLGATGAAVLAPRLRPFLLVLLLLLVRVIVAGSHLRRAKRQPAGERLPTLALSHISESTQPPVFQGRRRRMGCARPLCGAARGCGHGCASPGRGAASLARTCLEDTARGSHARGRGGARRICLLQALDGPVEDICALRACARLLQPQARSTYQQSGVFA